MADLICFLDTLTDGYRPPSRAADSPALAPMSARLESVPMKHAFEPCLRRAGRCRPYRLPGRQRTRPAPSSRARCRPISPSAASSPREEPLADRRDAARGRHRRAQCLADAPVLCFGSAASSRRRRPRSAARPRHAASHRRAPLCSRCGGPRADEAALQARLYPGNSGSPRHRVEPDYEYLHRELRRPGVTLQQLWVEYRRRSTPRRPAVLAVLPALPLLGGDHRCGHASAAPRR